MKKFLIILLTVAMTGCVAVSNKGVTQLQQFKEDSKTVAILEDEPTRNGVLGVITKWFSDNGFNSSVIQSASEVKPDDYVFSYRAHFGWDLAIYMRTAALKVKSKGKTLGALNFDALQYGGFGKFGDTEKRLRILLDVLFGKITREEADKLLGEA